MEKSHFETVTFGQKRVLNAKKSFWKGILKAETGSQCKKVILQLWPLDLVDAVLQFPEPPFEHCLTLNDFSP